MFASYRASAGAGNTVAPELAQIFIIRMSIARDRKRGPARPFQGPNLTTRSSIIKKNLSGSLAVFFFGIRLPFQIDGDQLQSGCS